MLEHCRLISIAEAADDADAPAGRFCRIAEALTMPSISVIGQYFAGASCDADGRAISMRC